MAKSKARGTSAQNARKCKKCKECNNICPKLEELLEGAVALLERDAPSGTVRRNDEYEYCPKCGRVIGTSAFFCKRCGQKIRQTPGDSWGYNPYQE